MAIRQYLIPSLAALCFVVVQHIDATSAYFKNASKHTVTFSINPSNVPNAAGGAFPDAYAVKTVTLAPGETINKYVYAQMNISGIGVSATGPIRILGKQGERFFEGTNGGMNIEIPIGQIWEFDIVDM